ncbi:MAG TPA: helix-turn-helix transcriptional regulator [Candidatus Cloacimonadota bacterium]|jgi:DNA-binding CsgD family transcriptional regulator|nr:helix-turn-helix transcriptional regulator [Candidatus Cloacimonadota bacterium]
MKEKGCLSKREKQVLIMISRGLTSKQISQELFISVTTVNTHRRNLLRKSNTKNVAELICFGYKTSLIS